MNVLSTGYRALWRGILTALMLSVWGYSPVARADAPPEELPPLMLVDEFGLYPDHATRQESPAWNEKELPYTCTVPSRLWRWAVQQATDEEYAAAEAALHRLLSCRGRFADAVRTRSRILMGWILLHTERPQAAYAMLPSGRLPVRLRPLADAVAFWRIEALRDSGRHKKALSMLRSYLRTWQRGRFRMKALRLELELLLALHRPDTAYRKGRGVFNEIHELEEKENFAGSHEEAASVLLLRARAAGALGKQRQRSEMLMKLFTEYPHTIAAATAERRIGTDIEPLVMDCTDNDPEKLYSILRSFYRNGKGQLALRILARRWRDNPVEFKGVRARMGTLLGDVYLKLRMDEEARQIFSTLVSLWPDDKLADYWLKRLAKAYSRLGDWMGASEHFLTLWKRHRDDGNGARFLFYYAWQKGMAGEFRIARSALDQYMEYPRLRSRDIMTALWFKAWFAYRAGLYETALAELEALTAEYPRRNPYDDPAAYWKARIMERLGRHSDALRAYTGVAQSSSLASYYPLLAWQRIQALAPTLGVTPKPPRWLPPADAPLPPDTPGLFPEMYLKARQQWLAPKHSPATWGKKAATLKTQCEIYEPLQRGLLLASVGVTDEARLENQTFFRTLRNHTHRGRVRLPGGCANPVSVLGSNGWLYDYLIATASYSEAYRLAQQYYFAYTKPPSYNERIRRLYPPYYAGEIVDASLAFHAPPQMVAAVMLTESRFSTLAVSVAGARGLLQLIPPTALKINARVDYPGFHPSMLNVPRHNIPFGVWYLGALLQRFNGAISLSAAAYNGGPHNVAMWLNKNGGLPLDEFVESIPFRETRRYVKKVTALTMRFSLVYTGYIIADDFTAPAPPQTGTQPDF